MNHNQGPDGELRHLPLTANNDLKTAEKRTLRVLLLRQQHCQQHRQQCRQQRVGAAAVSAAAGCQNVKVQTGKDIYQRTRPEVEFEEHCTGQM